MSSAVRLSSTWSVSIRQQFLIDGISEGRIRANVAGRRWQRIGRAYVTHNGPLTADQRRAAALACAGPRSILTSFTALEVAGLRGWERDEVHVLIGHRDRAPVVPGVAVITHRTSRWPDAVTTSGRSRLAHAAVLATASFRSARPGAGLLAALVQQRSSTVEALSAALTRASRTRHRRAMLLALGDIAMGSEALSEIDFARLCRRARLPLPDRQAVRVDAAGRRRYLDAAWRLPDGATLAVEVDGFLHLAPRRWWDDQLRQNELVIAGVRVIRFPSVVVREEPDLVVDTLRRALGPVDALRRR